MVMLGRMDAHINGFGTQPVFVGVRLREADGTQTLLPFSGVTQDDIQSVVEMMDELEALRVSGELSCLSEDHLLNNQVGRFGPTPMP